MITDKFGKILEINDTVVTVEDNKLRVGIVVNNTFKKDYMVVKFTDKSPGKPGVCKHRRHVIKMA